MINIEYNRRAAVDYANRWALSRNPAFYDYTGIGGDCTNFASQVVYAGCGVMNYTPDTGWYYIDANNKSPSWTGVQFFYNFITQNTSVGPFGREVPQYQAQLGDVVQLGNEADGYYHSLLIVGFEADSYLVAAQSNDAYMRRLDSYEIGRASCRERVFV